MNLLRHNFFSRARLPFDQDIAAAIRNQTDT
jgi:hypothetical protein